MKITIKNLGILDQAEFTLAPLTVICGENNTGKTYATYSLFGFLALWRDAYAIQVPEKDISSLLDEGVLHLSINEYISKAGQILDHWCKQYTSQLPTVFAAPEDKFANSKFEVSISKSGLRPKDSYEQRIRAGQADLFLLSKNSDADELTVTLLGEKEEKPRVPSGAARKVVSDALKDIIFSGAFPRPFLASAERTGAAIFRNELNFPRNRLLEEVSKSTKKLDPFQLLFKVYQDYALPVKRNVDFMLALESLAKKSSFIAKEHPDLLADFTSIISGEYAVTRGGQLYYRPKGKRIRLTMGESSSAVRSMLDLGFYLHHVAEPGDLLMVDEPELNLHPSNQRRVARLFARLVKLGIRVFITTHSDYIVKELNTLIMLARGTPHLKAVAERENYRPDELLSPDDVRLYMAGEALVDLGDGGRKKWRQTLTVADINPEYGIKVDSFDKTIDEMNRIQDEIVWGED